jgi:hypothetical protein
MPPANFDAALASSSGGVEADAVLVNANDMMMREKPRRPSASALCAYGIEQQFHRGIGGGHPARIVGSPDYAAPVQGRRDGIADSHHIHHRMTVTDARPIPPSLAVHNVSDGSR